MARLLCPKCGNKEKFYIEARSNVEVDGETGHVEDHDGFEWDDTAPCTCGECYHEADYNYFTVAWED